MIIKKMAKSFIKIIFIYCLFLSNSISASSNEFDIWLKNFRTTALSEGISEETFNKTMSSVKFLPKVIEYDRYQPEFYEDTKTYIGKDLIKIK